MISVPNISRVRPVAGRRVGVANHVRAPAIRCRAAVPRNMYPHPELIAETLQSFPEKAVASIEEGRALFSDGGYTILDVRSALAFDEGKVRGAVNVPLVKATRRFDAEQRKRVYSYSDVDPQDWIQQVQQKFRNKDIKLLVMCSTGKKSAIKALMALDDAGYTNLVGLQGGYSKWSQTFDNKLNRRVRGEYQENYSHGADSAGIHASGAHFAKVDPMGSGVEIIH